MHSRGGENGVRRASDTIQHLQFRSFITGARAHFDPASRILPGYSRRPNACCRYVSAAVTINTTFSRKIFHIGAYTLKPAEVRTACE